MIFITFFTLLVGFTTHPTLDGSLITLSETYVSENACALRIPAMRQIVDTLTASGIQLLDGAGCVPVADEATSDIPQPVVVASR